MTDQAAVPEVPPSESPPPGGLVAAAVERAFGAENRLRLLSGYFGAGATVAPTDAWKHAYRLLLWIDRTTGLAHCYESDKCQPGRPWYGRSLAFHAWLAGALGFSPDSVGEEIDLLFKRATSDLAAAAAARRASTAAAAERQREPYKGQSFPLPGEDPELEAIITEALSSYLASVPSAEGMRRLTERIQAHVGQENKRKNLVGEGFEDTVAQLLRRVPGVPERYELLVRPLLHDIPGFHRPRGAEKARQVDLVLVSRATGYRTLVSCKWSVRSDREEQFPSDFRSYSDLEAAGEDFGYVLVTNEFDPARLAAACENRRQNALLFSGVVHVNPDGPRAAYAAPVTQRGRGIGRALGHLESGRLSSLESWLLDLVAS